MNRVVLMGRLTRDPEVRYNTGANGKSSAFARYTLAVNRRGANNEADFINCVTFNKGAEFAEKYLRQGMKIAITGRIQTGSYTNKEGVKVYTTDIIVDEHEFAESKGGNSTAAPAAEPGTAPEPGSGLGDGFMNIPDDIDTEGLPF